MKVNLFKLSSSKSQHPFKIQQRTQSSIFNNQHETQQDSSRPIRIFNSQFSSKCIQYQHQDKFASNESFIKEKPLIVISEQITEQIIDKPRYNDFKDSYSFNKNKMSEAFTNADSKLYFTKEGELCHGTIDHNVTDTTFFSLHPHQSHCIEKKSERDKNCNCSQRSSVRLNTQELIKITNQRKELLSKMEETEKKRKNSVDNISIDPLQTSFEVEYNDKDCKEPVNPIVEDHTIYQGISIKNNHFDQEKEINNQNENKERVDMNKNSDSEKGLYLNQYEDNIQFSISINKNLQLMNSGSFDEFANFSLTKDQFTIEQSKRDDNQSKIDFKIEIGSEIIRKHNQPESFCDEEDDIIEIQDPFKGTLMSLKEEVTEINEIDINRNKIQNETKIIIDIEPEVKPTDKIITNPLLIDPFNCLLNYEKNKKNAETKPDYSKYITKQKQTNSNDNTYKNYQVDIKKMNFFEETLKKILPNNDKVNEDIIMDNLKAVKKQNNRYEQSNHNIMIPQLHINAAKPIKTIKTADLSHDHQRILSQITPTQSKMNDYHTEKNNRQNNTRANSCGRDRHKQSNSPKKKDRKPKKYTDLYMKKLHTNEISNNNNVTNNKQSDRKNINRSCDVSELIYKSDNLTQRSKTKIKSSKKINQPGRNIDILIDNKVHIYDTQE